MFAQTIALTLVLSAGAGAGLSAGVGQARPTAPAACGPGAASEMRNVAPETRCFELRTYTATGRIGDIDLLHARFREHSIRLLEQHGMSIMGFWQPVERPDTLIYLVAYPDAAARDAAWAAFQADPEWQQVVKAMDVSLEVESIYMVATDYGRMK